jgi:hypothetical protein
VVLTLISGKRRREVFMAAKKRGKREMAAKVFIKWKRLVRGRNFFQF